MTGEGNVKSLAPVEDDVLADEFEITSLSRTNGDFSPDVEPDVISTTFYMRIKVGPGFQSVKSREFILQGKRSYVQVSKGEKNGIDYLRIFVWIYGEDLSVDVGRKVDASFTLVSTVASYTVPIGEFEWDWRVPMSYGFNNFLSWKDLHDPASGFVRNHRALLRISLNVNDPFVINYKM